ncbi:MAG TPA: ROK family protein, partial [Spirochaetales bacterium]|nr:ROK family protein [Spirochaetales bacterium]
VHFKDSQEVVRVDAAGEPVSTKLSQRPTDAHKGKEHVLLGWVDAIDAYLSENGRTWDDVGGVGLAIPGPFLAPGVLGLAANLPKELDGWDVGSDYATAIAKASGRPVKVTVGNDGNYGGVAEARLVRGNGKGTVLMLAPGSGLGVAYVDDRGLPLDGASLVGMEAGHMPAPLHLLGMPAFSCGCGRDWGCVEAYTTISGLPQLLAVMLERHPEHPLASSPLPVKEKVLSLRTLAQSGDPLATEVFDFQAKALGLHVAALAMAVDPEYVVIGGGLMDPEATTAAFRERYMRTLEESAREQLWPSQRKRIKYSQARLGDLSQAIGAALVALYGDEGR